MKSFREIDLNLLIVFDAIMQERNVSRAADRIFRSQSAVSHSLSRLRDIFDDDLFLRISGGVEPTPRAKELAKGIGIALWEIQSTLDEYFIFDPKETERVFKVGMSDYTAFVFLPKLIKELRKLAPKASIKVSHVGNENVNSMVNSGEFDCFILGNAKVNSSQVKETRLFNDKMLGAMCRDNPNKEYPLTLERFLSMPHLQISTDKASPGALDKALQERDKKLSRNIVATTPHYLVVPELLSGTDMVTVFGESILLAFSKSKHITLFEPPISLADVSISLYNNKRQSSDPANKWFRSIVLKISRMIKQQKEERYKRLISDVTDDINT